MFRFYIFLFFFLVSGFCRAAVVRVFNQGPHINPIVSAIHSINNFDTILVMGSVNEYPVVDITTDKKFTIIGPGIASGLPAILRDINIHAPVSNNDYTIFYYGLDPQSSCTQLSNLVLHTNLNEGKTIENIHIEGLVIKGEINFIPSEYIMGLSNGDFCLAQQKAQRVYTKTRFRNITIKNNLILGGINLSYNSARYEDFLIEGNFFYSSIAIRGNLSYSQTQALPPSYSSSPNALGNQTYYSPARLADSAGNSGHIIRENIFRVLGAAFDRIYVRQNGKQILVENNVFYSGVSNEKTFDYLFTANPNPWYIDPNFGTGFLRNSSNVFGTENLLHYDGGRGVLHRNNIFSRVKMNNDTILTERMDSAIFSHNITYQCSNNFPWLSAFTIDAGFNQTSNQPLFTFQSKIDSGIADPYMLFTTTNNSIAKSSGFNSKDIGIQFNPITGLPISGLLNIKTPNIIQFECAGYPFGRYDLGLDESFALSIKTDIKIVAIEYFLDTDPGDNLGTSIGFQIVDSTQSGYAMIAYANSAFVEGNRKVYVRVKNNLGFWSLAYEAKLNISKRYNNIEDINEAEYFFDKDPGVSKAKKLFISNVNDTLNIITGLNIQGLGPGLHTVHLRVKTSGHLWSVFSSSILVVEDTVSNLAQISRVEYFFDKDPGVGNGYFFPNSIIKDTISLINNVNSNLLKPGLHSLHFRVRNKDGIWSMASSSMFFKEPPNPNFEPIIKAEYFFDKDPGVGFANAVNVSSADSLVDSLNINCSNINKGLHSLFLRVMNADSVWSMVSSSIFINDSLSSNLSAITRAEYFFDTDPGVYNSTPVILNSSNDTTILELPIGVSQLQEGMHTIHFRFMNNETASHFQSSVFNITKREENLSDIIKFEYFSNKDSVKFYSMSTPSGNFDTTLRFYLNGLTGFNNALFIRAINTSEVPGMYEKESFIYCSDTIADPVFISNNNYCVGDSLKLSVLSPNTQLIYEWKTPKGIITNSQINFLINDQSFEGEYELRSYKNNAGVCDTSRKVKMYIHINDLPIFDTINYGSSTLLCRNEISTLSIQPDSNTKYTWFKNNQLLMDTTASITISDSGIYRVIKTNSSGCSIEIDSVQIFISDTIETPILKSELKYCVGDELNINIQNLDTQLVYRWNTPFGEIFADSIIIQSVNNNAAGIYSLKSYKANSTKCDTSVEVQINIEVFDLPEKKTVQVIGSKLLCTNDTVILSLPTDTSLLYTWIKNDSIILSNTHNEIQVTDSGTYYVVIANKDLCVVNSDTITITKLKSPIATSINGELLAYNNKNIYTYYTLDKAEHYLWNVERGEILQDFGDTIVVKFEAQQSSANIQLQLRDSICLSNIINTTIALLTYEDTLNVSLDSVFISQKENAFSFFLESNITWSIVNSSSWLNINPIFGVGNDSIRVQIEENTSVVSRISNVIINADTLQRTIVIVQAGKPVAVESNKHSRDIMLYPNPASNIFYIKGDNIDQVKVYNMQGQFILVSNYIKEGIDISKLSPGMYFVEISANSETQTFKIVKE